MVYLIKNNNVIIESNRHLKKVILDFINGAIDELLMKRMDSNGWLKLNKGIFLRFFEDETMGKELFQIAIEESRFDNEYLLDHTLNIVSKMISKVIDSDSWGRTNGTDLNIVDKGKASSFRYLEREHPIPDKYKKEVA